MKFWIAALAGLALPMPSLFAAAAMSPQSSPPAATGQTGPTTATTASYGFVSFGASTADGQGASTGASYGRVDSVGVTAVLAPTPSLGGGAYSLLAGWNGGTLSTLQLFEMLSLAPSAGFPLSNVTIPRDASLTGSISVRFDGLLAPQEASANPDQLKVSAPSHSPGPVDVTIDSATKSITYESGFAYVPALNVPKQVSIGKHLQVRAFGSPGATFWVVCSEALGSPISIPGIDGTLDVDPTAMTFLGNITIPAALAGGAISHEGFLEFDIPQNPALVGKTYFVQAATYDASLLGSPTAFTNHTVITVQN